jgi:hypothetical protein
MRGSAPDGLPRPLPQQLDTEGRVHDVTPQSEVMPLFRREPQLAGRVWLRLEGDV